MRTELRKAWSSSVRGDRLAHHDAAASGLGSQAPWHPGAMDKVLVPVRDLTDSDQNQAVLDVASTLVEDQTAAERVAASHGPAVAAEAVAAARSRRPVGGLARPVRHAGGVG